MVDTSKCFSLVRGRALRATKLDACGAKSLGPKSTVNTDGFISVAFTANTDEGETISQANAAGRICILDEPAPLFLGYTVEIQFCGVNPDLYGLMTGQPVVFDDQATPQGVGFQVNDNVNIDGQGFALELWSNVPGAVCAGGVTQYGYLLIPFLKGGIIGDFTVENAAVNFTLSGAKSRTGNAWGVGPYNVIKTAAGAASPLLVALPTTNHLHMQLTTLAPPTAVCGATALGTLATGYTAGIPATPTPANSYSHNTLAALIAAAPTKTPATLWTTGQHVLLQDGTHAYWNATTWIAGDAP
jgi:hypothetical protein